jgi:hypothetical protein
VKPRVPDAVQRSSRCSAERDPQYIDGHRIGIARALRSIRGTILPPSCPFRLLSFSFVI